ncbi:MAG TPA: TlpA disulfide reductase family protein [Gaiellaceae bacterium]|nr:TlpA disulfide reductase family protein [Gaiellaceae bacterium]
MRLVRIAAAAAVIALLAVLVWDVAHRSGGRVARDVDHGEIVKAPAFALPKTTGGGKLSLASFRGKVVVLNFWASDCVPCKQEQKQLNEAAARWAAKGVVFLGIDEIDLNGPARAYLRHYRVSYPSVSDGDGAVAGKFGVTGTPETFFIDRRGRVVPPHIVAPPQGDALEAGIRRALSA